MVDFSDQSSGRTLSMTENFTVEDRRKAEGLRERSFITSSQTTTAHCAYKPKKNKQVN